MRLMRVKQWAKLSFTISFGLALSQQLVREASVSADRLTNKRLSLSDGGGENPSPTLMARNDDTNHQEFVSIAPIRTIRDFETVSGFDAICVR